MADAGPLLHLATNLVKASAVARTTLARRAIDLSAASRSPRMLVTSSKMCCRRTCFVRNKSSRYLSKPQAAEVHFHLAEEGAIAPSLVVLVAALGL